MVVFAMSDIPPLCPMHTCLQWKLCVESHSLGYLFLFSIYKSAVLRLFSSR